VSEQESRGVAEILIRLADERPRATLSRARLARPPMTLRDFAHESTIDDAILDGVDRRWTKYAPGVTSEVREDEPDEEIVEAIQACRRQFIVRPIKRLEDELESVASKLKRKPGLAAPLSVNESIPWWEQWPPFDQWSVGVIRDYRDSRREWVWCEAGRQRRIHPRSEGEMETVYTERLRDKARKEQAKRLAEKLEAATRRTRAPGGPAKMDER